MTEEIVISQGSFHWLDLVDPTKAQLEAVAQKYGLHPTSVQDCMDPEHLPKYEQMSNLRFVILRSYDETCNQEADTIQELTRKLAIFYSDQFLITIHRKDQPYIFQIKEKWKKEQHLESIPVPQVLADLLRGVFHSYDRPIDFAYNQLERLEMGVFGAQGAQPFEVKRGYFLKRQASVFKRMLRLSIDVLPKMSSRLDVNTPHFQDLKEEAESLYFFSDELIESVNSLLNLHLSLASQKTNEASHRTNEVVRVLTIFSVFLLPLNVLTGIYGMNFEHMPELKWHYGYPAVLLSMILVTAIIYFWFRKQGWLK